MKHILDIYMWKIYANILGIVYIVAECLTNLPRLINSAWDQRRGPSLLSFPAQFAEN